MSSSDPSSTTASVSGFAQKKPGWLEILGPGILVAATGVGAGDLAGGALAGAKLKLAVVWVVIVGAGLKFVLCEGLARWQLQTGTSLPDGVFRSVPSAIRYVFLIYVIAWSFSIGGMLMSACGECAQAILPIGSSSQGRVVHGWLHSLAAILLVRIGGFRLFERFMTACIAMMFMTVLVVAVLSQPNWSRVVQGLFIPSIPDAGGKGIEWTLTLMAGVGGTLTMLCYGTWIREKHRIDVSSLRMCRIDLAAGYLMTALFGVAMVILGSRLPVGPGLSGANLINQLGSDMQTHLGAYGNIGSWMFRLGAWGAVFSSLLGVWQSIPALMIEMYAPPSDGTAADVTDSRGYHVMLVLLGTLPGLWLPYSLATVQKIAGVTGALFLPMFALALLLLPFGKAGRRSGFKNAWSTWTVLLTSLVIFGILAMQKLAAIPG